MSEPSHRENEEYDQKHQAHRMRVLVVDDNQDAGDTLATCLELAGHPSGVAFGAIAAIDV